MLLALFGITGIGKSFFKNLISDELGFEKVCTIRTRPMRKNEVQNEDNLFITNKELDLLKSEGKIAYSFDVFGGSYAYTKEDIFSDKNKVFEMHYEKIYDWKKIRPDIKTIYLMPKDLNIAKEKTCQRNLSKEKEEERLMEIDEHYNKICSDTELRNMFDYIIYNNYDKHSEEEVIALVKKILNEQY